MPSAITGNVLGPASSSSAGLVTTAAQTFAGDKTLTGLTTASGGIINTGLTGANATAAFTAGSGKVGERISYNYNQTVTVSSSVYTNLQFASGVTSVTMQPGLWLMKLGVVESSNATSNVGHRIGLSADSSTGFADAVFGYNLTDSTGPNSVWNQTSHVTIYQNITTATPYYIKANVATSISKTWVIAFFAVRID